MWRAECLPVTTPTAPAAQLRAAAARLREAADAAYSVWAATYVAPEASPWAHIVSPAVAAPLVAWLESNVSLVEGPCALPHGFVGDQTIHALAVARAILAATPTGTPGGGM